MNKSLLMILLLITGSVIKALISVGLMLYFLAIGENGPLAFLLPYTEVILLLSVLVSFFIGHKSSEFERALRQYEAHQENYFQLKPVEKNAAD